MERKYLLDYVAVTEAAAAACSALVGSGNKNDADALAVAAMRRAFDDVPARGKVVIGEGEMDEAPMLYIGEEVGPKDTSLPMFDIAVDPLEGTSLCAKAQPGAIATLAVAGEGMLLAAPDMYMHKIATGPAGRGVVDLEKTPHQNATALAKALGKPITELMVVVLDRDRHLSIVDELHHLGVRVMQLGDGDVAPAVATAIPGTGIDMMMGIGGAPEGVLAAAALRALGGEFQGRLAFLDDSEKSRAKSMGLDDPDQKLLRDDIVRGDCLFVASGVTTGPFLRGVSRSGSNVRIHSICIDSRSGRVRYIETLMDQAREG